MAKLSNLVGEVPTVHLLLEDRACLLFVFGIFFNSRISQPNVKYILEELAYKHLLYATEKRNSDYPGILKEFETGLNRVNFDFSNLVKSHFAEKTSLK